MKKNASPDNCSMHVTYMPAYDGLNATIKKITAARKKGILTVYNPTPLLYDFDKNECSFLKKEKLLYAYDDHLSTYTASMIARELDPIVGNLIQ